MIELIAHNMAPIMFGSLVVFMLLGYPVAFALAANGLLFFVIGVELAPYSNGEITLFWPLLQALPDRFWGIMSNETMLAIPFFTFMGLILERSGMAEDLLDTIGQLFGPVRGGLAYAVVLVGALLAATTGVVAASVISMGLISLPIMLRYGYDRRLATGVIAASGTLAQIIPPSIVLIVLADQLGRSVGDMYAGAIYPAIVLTGLYLGYVFLMSTFLPKVAPALPAEARALGGGVKSLFVLGAATIALAFLLNQLWLPSLGENAGIWSLTAAVALAYVYALLDRALNLNTLSRLARTVVVVLVPPLALIFLVLGTIFLGIATPTEGGAMGAAGALVLSAMKRKLSMDVVRQALKTTTRLASFVMFILIGARVFSLTFYGVNGHIWVEELLTGVPGGTLGFLIIVNALVFFLAFFLDFFELAFIIVPLLAPVADKLGIDLIWFGILLGVNMQTSFMHPPFGFSLFYLRSVAPRLPYLDRITKKEIAPVTTGQIYWGAVPFVLIQVIMVGVVIAFPGLVMHYREERVQVDPNSIEIVVPGFGGGGLSLPPLGGAEEQSDALGLPPFGLDGAPPSFGEPAAPANVADPEDGGGTDLSQPPSF
ncbi:MAG: TRAP transporter large permease subunit [Alphaproteobacteria bacterium]|nr:TRAP transporter large permease subunit [Alphaproteobacteria bacterium]